MPPTHVDCSRSNVQIEEEVLDAICAYPLTAAHQVANETGLSQSALWGTLYEEQLYSFHIWFIRAQELATYVTI
jgi:hypothetical protein